MKKVLKFFIFVAFVGAIVGSAYYYREPLLREYGVFSKKLSYIVNSEITTLTGQCQKPIYYQIGTVDRRFNVSQSELSLALAEASDIWSKAIGRQLLATSTSGQLKINMTYDYRQEATDKLKKLGIIVTGDKKSYTDLKQKYDQLNLQYIAKKDILETQIADLKFRQTAYEAEVAKWNSKGGAPPNEYERLNNLRTSLNAQVDEVNKLSDQVNVMVDNLNAEGTALNKLIEQLNLTVEKYNNVGAKTGEEFQEGVYTQGPDGESITVFEFSSQNQLLRLLTHEFGHALGLGHSTGTQDIMYYLNEAKDIELSANDLAAIKSKCGIKQTD